MRGDSPGNQILLLQLVTDGLRSVLFDEPGPRADSLDRSEEHTSELSHGYISYAVFCLKKKNTAAQTLHPPRQDTYTPTTLLLKKLVQIRTGRGRPHTSVAQVLLSTRNLDRARRC